jgi:hypothetical protein
LLPTLCWPAFALHENPIKDRAVDKIIRRLKGRYGLKRFLRDGYKTVMEDRSRKYYRPAEVKVSQMLKVVWYGLVRVVALGPQTPKHIIESEDRWPLQSETYMHILFYLYAQQLNFCVFFFRTLMGLNASGQCSCCT